MSLALLRGYCGPQSVRSHSQVVVVVFPSADTFSLVLIRISGLFSFSVALFALLSTGAQVPEAMGGSAGAQFVDLGCRTGSFFGMMSWGS